MVMFRRARRAWLVAAGFGTILLDCKNYRYGHRLTLTDSDAANSVSKYVDQFGPDGYESGLRTTCWFYAESTGVPNHNYLYNINHMQRGETEAKIFL